MIGYAFGYEGLGIQAGNPEFMIRAAYPQIVNYYAIIASFLFSLSYSTVGVFAGNMTKTMSRKVMLGMACILWSCSTFGAGAIPSFGAFCLMRFLCGGFATCSNASSFGLLADYFPPERRSLANAIESSGTYVGAAMASCSVILIKNFGWRTMYKITGVFGMLIGLAVLLLVKEPKRGAFDPKIMKKEEEVEVNVVAPPTNPFKDFVNSLKAVFKNPVAKWTTLAGMFRYFETFSVLYFAPSFFMRVYPEFKVAFGYQYALIMAICGFISSIVCGLISDKYEKKSLMTKALVCIAGSVIGIPAIMSCTLVTNNFYWCLASIALKFIVSEGWLSPSITMM